MVFSGKASTLAALLASCAVVAPALAQDAAYGASSDRLDEIVITAQKRSESLQRVPVAVTALSQNAIAGANIEATVSLSKVTPNLTITVNNTNASPYIRGIGSQFANPGLENSVSVYFDDMYMPRASSAVFSFNDIERIEVLKGPQGTLYGRNATGGAIRIITKDPRHEFQAEGALTYGSDERLAVEAMVNAPIADGLAVRMSYRHDENRGFVKNVGEGGPRYLNGRNEDFLHGKLLYDGIDNLTIKLSGDYVSKRDTEGFAFTNLFPGGPEQIGAAMGGNVATGFHTTSTNIANNGVDLKNWGLSLRVEYDAGPVTLASITSYRDEDQETFGDLDATDADLQQAYFRQLTRQWTQEFQLVSAADGPLTYVAGLYLLDEKSRAPFGIFGSSVGDGTFFGSDGKVHTTSIAPYGQADYAFSDAFKLTVGARYTAEKKKLVYSHGLLGTTANGAFPGDAVIAPTGDCTAAGQILCAAPAAAPKFKQFTPKATLSYTPIDRVMLYVTYSRGFKSGGLNLPAFGTVDEVKPEILDAYEFGWKTEFGTVRFNGAAFYYDYKDLQQQITDQSTGGTRAVNAASARVWGLESDLLWKATDRLEIGVGGGYLNTKYKDYIGDAYVPCGMASTNASCIDQGGLGLALLPGQDFSGNRLVNAPKYTGYVRVDYEQPLAPGYGSLRFNTTANYRSASNYDPAGLFVERKRAMLSAKLTWLSEDESYYVSVYGENLTDRNYNVIMAPQSSGGWRIQGAPRQVYVQAGFKF